MSEILNQVRNIILVLSGKGGVGKSTVAVQLALALQEANQKVGLLDIDLCGPSVPKMLGLEKQDIFQGKDGWMPVSLGEEPALKVMSIGFLLKEQDNAVIWRGPKKNAMIKQFLIDVCWGELDFLVVDTPPGTSDEHISVVECLKQFRHPDGAILVTTPQALAVGDVRREISFCKKAEVPIIGILENMSGFVCPHCSECTNIFSSGGGQSLAQLANVPFLGSIPVDQNLGKSLEEGRNYLTNFKESEVTLKFKMIIEKLMDKIVAKNSD